MAKDKKDKETKPLAISAEIKQLLEAAARPPQKIDRKEDSRAAVLAVFAETIAVGFQVIGVIAEHVTSAPHHPNTELRQ